MQPAGSAGDASAHQLGPVTPATGERLRTARIERTPGGNGIEPRHGTINLMKALVISHDVELVGETVNKVFYLDANRQQIDIYNMAAISPDV